MVNNYIENQIDVEDQNSMKMKESLLSHIKDEF